MQKIKVLGYAREGFFLLSPPLSPTHQPAPHLFLRGKKNNLRGKKKILQGKKNKAAALQVLELTSRRAQHSHREDANEHCPTSPCFTKNASQLRAMRSVQKED